jgi:two-component system cell cycle response regulator
VTRLSPPGDAGTRIASAGTVPLSRHYALLGVLTGLVAPAGMFTYLLLAGSKFDPVELFVATAAGAVATLGAAGWMIGRRDDVLRRRNDELRALSRRLTALSVTDPLTGIANRRAFDERLAVEVARSTRYRVPLTLVMLDLDHFKQLNDRFGHLAGDEVLRAVAAVLDREKRAGDLVARFGGEEFAAILPHTGAAASLAWAERVRGSIAALAVSTAELSALTVTASFGVAECVPGEGPRRVLDDADAALYRAKRGGRNRVVTAGLSAPRRAG